ncbi:Bax inhibitor 1 [Psilocybe cubensis]|uniref:Bax inhibitor 1 n=1 Tax=Psilocybe cubensis TaxID=181762 RepID=A0ACB8HEE0_PSICU|nr:Bax inhibitor 1 [Psilocybe cubensis]KAH9485539.1 Bax inhibitor 1 [Psilocybe cubensis]
MSNYPVPPPAYGPTGSNKTTNYHTIQEESREPLLAGSSRNGGTGGYYDQPGEGDLPDDFKYGVSVSESSPEIRNAFIRKVYMILREQGATTVLGGLISQSPEAIFWVQTHTWIFYITLIGTLVNLGLLYWKRHTHPWNLVLLSTFTLLEASTLGVAISFYQTTLVLQALLITTGVFLGLSLFTLQSKYEFDGMGPFLFGGLMALCMTGLVGIFIPFSRTMDLVMAIGGCLIFSGYIVYDTYIINKRLSPDEYIMGSISLYLE